MALTKLENLVDPEVMAQMVSAKLPKKIKFSPIARIDTTLAGRPGSTITVPKYAYIGDAEDVAVFRLGRWPGSCGLHLLLSDKTFLSTHI